MIKIFVVDDHIIFREGLKRVISRTSDIDLAGECGDGLKALHTILKNKYDLVLLDLAFPGMEGLDMLRELKKHRRDLPVLVLSMYGEEQYALHVLKEGASGYPTKESVPNDLIYAIRKAAVGGRYISSTLGEKLICQLSGEHDQKSHEHLSNREYQVFHMIVTGQSIKEIAYELGLARTTVTSYRSRVMEKMEMKTNADLIRYALTHNLLQ